MRSLFTAWIDFAPIAKPAKQAPRCRKDAPTAQLCNGIWWHDWRGNLIVPTVQTELSNWPSSRNRLGIVVPPRERLSHDELDRLMVAQGFLHFMGNSRGGWSWYNYDWACAPISNSYRAARCRATFIGESYSWFRPRGESLPFGLPSRVPDPPQSQARLNRRMRNRLLRLRKAWRVLLKMLAMPMVESSGAQTELARKIAYRLAVKEVKRRLAPRNRWILASIDDVNPQTGIPRHETLMSPVSQDADDVLVARVCYALGEHATHLLSLGCSVNRVSAECGLPRTTIRERIARVRQSLAGDYAPRRERVQVID